MGHAAHPYRIYWITWLILLIVTLSMLLAERFHLPKAFLVLFLLAFMLVKATMIAGNFMHLRSERRNMAIMVAVGLLLTSLILFTAITPESFNVLHRSTQ